MRIKRIHISNYRAFLVNDDKEIKRYVIELPRGENLLIYGENGSGKSSLFKALKDFFTSSGNRSLPFDRNLFYNEDNNSEQPFIGITLNDDSEHFFSSEVARTNTNQNPAIVEANTTKGFISYRDLLKLHFKHNNEDLNLFSFFLGKSGLFADVIVASPQHHSNKITFQALWNKIEEHKREDAILDYNTNALSQFQELEKKANLLLKYFQRECTLIINYADCILDGDILKPPLITFEIELFGNSILGHGEILNEARLTSLAISVYLAHILALPPTSIRILFLDDIFIGLDMSNRIPLVKILTSDNLGNGTSFSDFQIFLTTYDREWFSVAKSYFGDGWEKIEFYVDTQNQFPERPFIRRSETYLERAKFHFITGDYPACANYMRKEFERSFRRILPENTLYPGFSSITGDNSTVALSKRLLAIKENDEAWFFKLKDVEDQSIKHFKFLTLQLMIEQFKRLIDQYYIPFHYIDELSVIKNRLLNPLSHDDLKSAIFKSELQIGFKILEELENITSKVVISIENTSAIQLFCNKQDFNGFDYYYRFELKENLRFLQYDTFKIFLNAKMRSLFRTKGYNFEVREYDYPSLRKLCESVFHASTPSDVQYIFDENFMFQEVYITDNQKRLSELI